MPSKQVYARQRLMAGAVGGFVAQLIIALILGLILAGGINFGVRVTASLISSVIATPALLSVGFALMLKEDSRPLGGGILGGALVSTLLWFVLYLVT